MHNPVSVLVVFLIGLAGAALGYWLVRKFVISEDGSVDVGVAQFVKWAMRIVGFTCVFQSTLDTYLALTAQGITLVICFAFTRFKWKNLKQLSFHGNKSPQEPTRGRATANHTRDHYFLDRVPSTCFLFTQLDPKMYTLDLQQGITGLRNNRRDNRHFMLPMDGLVLWWLAVSARTPFVSQVTSNSFEEHFSYCARPVQVVGL